MMSDSESSQTLLTNTTNPEIKSYSRRWLVLLIAWMGIFLRSFNQSCFGNINNVYVEYFNKAAWQIDWFVLAQSVTMTLSMPPMLIAAKKMNVRLTLCFTTALSFTAYLMTAAGHLTRNGYSAVVIGQAIEGISGIASWCLLSFVPAVWFPPHQVAIAVGILVVGRGMGEAAGSITPPFIVSMKSAPEQVKWNLFAMFATLAVISFLMFIMSFLFSSGPPTPPSEAEVKALDLRFREQTATLSELLKNIVTSIKHLFTSKNFLIVWFVMGVFTPTLRNNNILLSSMLHKTFPKVSDIDENVGVFIGVAWLLLTLGGFVAGPIIAKTHRYKEIVLASILGMLVSAILILIGFQCQITYLVYSGLLLQGLSSGVVFTSLLELLTEVTYPENTLFVIMLTIAVVGFFRVLFPIGERVLLDKVNATAANLIPVVMLFVCFVLILFVTKDYRRSFANNEQEVEILVSPSPNVDNQRTEE